VRPALAAALFGGVLLAAPAPAVECPPGTDARTARVAGHTQTVCVPGVYCFPLGCDPWLTS
jgi:hypothetical protein